MRAASLLGKSRNKCHSHHQQHQRARLRNRRQLEIAGRIKRARVGGEGHRVELPVDRAIQETRKESVSDVGARNFKGAARRSGALRDASHKRFQRVRWGVPSQSGVDKLTAWQVGRVHDRLGAAVPIAKLRNLGVIAVTVETKERVSLKVQEVVVLVAGGVAAWLLRHRYVERYNRFRDPVLGL